MDKGDIRIRKAIVHILDAQVGMPVLSDNELDFGSDMSDFLEEHIFKTLHNDEIKKCRFIEEESDVYRILEEYRDEKTEFVDMSKEMAQKLYSIMNANIDILSGDLFVILYEVNMVKSLAVLKMNFKDSYTHTTISDGMENTNSIMKHHSILPGTGQKLTEAAIISMDDLSIKLIEKKYEVNGKKTNYFSQMFLNCTTKMSQKAKLNIVEKAVEAVQKEFFNESEQFEEKMKAKSVIHKEIEEQGEINIPEVVDRIFEDNVTMKEAFKEKIEKYHIDEAEPIVPKNETTTKKYGKQHLTTDTGIEIKIPMEQYNSTENIEFITNMDGTISVLIKNIGHITSK